MVNDDVEIILVTSEFRVKGVKLFDCWDKRRDHLVFTNNLDLVDELNEQVMGEFLEEYYSDGYIIEDYEITVVKG